MIVIGGEGSLVGTVLGAIDVDAVPERADRGRRDGRRRLADRQQRGAQVADADHEHRVRLVDPCRPDLRSDRPERALAQDQERVRRAGPTRHDDDGRPTAAEARRGADRLLLAVNNVEVVYGVSLAVRGVSFDVPENGVVALLGPNGAGKTSIIRAVSGLLADARRARCATGDIILDGKSVKGAAPDKIVARGVGQVPEGRLVFRQLTVEENLRVGASARERGRASGESIDADLRALPRPRASVASRRRGGSRAASSRCSRSGGR